MTAWQYIRKMSICCRSSWWIPAQEADTTSFWRCILLGIFASSIWTGVGVGRSPAPIEKCATITSTLESPKPFLSKDFRFPKHQIQNSLLDLTICPTNCRHFHDQGRCLHVASIDLMLGAKPQALHLCTHLVSRWRHDPSGCHETRHFDVMLLSA